MTQAFEKSLGSQAQAFEKIATLAGAESMDVVTEQEDMGSPDVSTLVLGIADDAQAATLSTAGWRIYEKDILTLSALRGKVDLDSDEFLLPYRESSEPLAKRRRVSKRR